MPMVKSLALPSEEFKISFKALFNLSIIGLGVFAGANKPTQSSITKSFTPFSIKVGTSGMLGLLFALDTAIALIRPELTYGLAPATAV